MLVWDLPHLGKLDKHVGEVFEGLFVKVVLMRLHIAELRKGLVTIIESADEGLQTLVCFFVRSNITPLGKRLAAKAARVWLFTGVATHVSLEVAPLREGETAVLLATDIRLETSVRATVDVEMSLLDEALVAAGSIAHPLLLGLQLLGGRSAARTRRTLCVRTTIAPWRMGWG